MSIQEPLGKKTKEHIMLEYNDAIMIVNLINAGKRKYQTDTNWENEVGRFKLHLENMLTKDFWTNEDLSPIVNALKYTVVKTSAQVAVAVAVPPVARLLPFPLPSQPPFPLE